LEAGGWQSGDPQNREAQVCEVGFLSVLLDQLRVVIAPPLRHHYGAIMASLWRSCFP
jgi:hypothetical protein